MTGFRVFLSRLTALFRRGRLEQELEEELQFHFQQQIEHHLRQGMSAEEARYAARKSFGGLDRARENYREVRGIPQIEILIQDFCYAVRRLMRNPGFSVVAVLTLALAIGANTAIFSVADAVLFRPLPYKDPDRLYILQMLDHQTGKQYTLVPYDQLQAINAHHRGVSEVGILEPAPVLLSVTADGTERVPAAEVTANYFDILGVRPARGRLFDSRDSAQSGRTAILSYAAWQQRFGGDDSVVGRSVAFGARTVDIVGVLPAGFVFPSAFQQFFGGKPEIVAVLPPLRPGAQGGTLHPIVRLEPGVTREQAQAEIQALAAPIANANPRTAGQAPALNDVRSLLYAGGRPVMTLLLAASALVLLTGCANLAIMVLARVQRGVRETGVRAALGASRIRLVLPVFFEATLIGLGGALVAVLATSVTFDALLRLVPPIAYGNAPVGVDLRVTLYALGLGLVGGLVFAAVPAWRSARMDALALIQGREERVVRRGRLGRPLIAVQVALAVVLVSGAVVVGRAFLSVLSVPFGFNPESVLTVRVIPALQSGVARQAFYVRIIEALSRRGDVISASASGQLPLDGSGPNEALRIPGAASRASGIVHVLPGYFETVGIPLRQGRLLDWNDVRGGGEAAILSESAARALFPGRDPLGATFENLSSRQFRVVGVVADTLLTPTLEPLAYVIPADATRFLTLVIHTRGHQNTTLAAIRREINMLAPGTPITAQWWTDTISALTAYRNPRFQTVVLGAFAGLALVLTALGIFGVVAFSVAIRTREMGIRMALGAVPKSLVGLMVRQALAPVLAGLLIGLLATKWAARLAEAQLFQVQTRDAMTLASAAVVVTMAAFLAAYVPARRASRVDPAIVLRAE